jgi:hypothetical protein
MAKYDDIRKSLKTGDIVLFSGKGGISSLIKWFTKSQWSHVGMVIRSTEWDSLLLWESTTLSKLKDIESDTARQGVQLVLLSERIYNYDGEIGIRRLITEKVIKTQPLMDLRKELKGRPYEQNKIELFKSAYDGAWGENEEDLSSIFCSEAIAEAFQRWGFLPESIPSNEYTPADFGGNIGLIDAELDNVIKIEV